ncbi:MAG: zinc ribbon domain-containing protein [Chloroflexi bacterium]|nr:zinc ribbon domain-containing protein [Chloroflexota bacterium]
MSSIINRLRTGAGKAGLEADKLRRTTALQVTIRSLRQEIEKGIGEVGQVAFALYQQGQIMQPELQELQIACQTVANLYAQIAAHEKEIENIRSEEYDDPEQATYGHICPNGHGRLAPENRFCPKCGATAINVPAPAMVRCHQCGTSLEANIRFCSSCGTPVTPQTSFDQSPALAESTLNISASKPICPQCSATLMANAVFCIECGYRLAQA